MKTLTYAFRFLIRSKSYTLINLLGLAFSLACSIILMRYIHRELTVDTHCVDREQVIACLRDMHGNVYTASPMYMDSVYIKDEQVIKRCKMVIERNTNVVYDKQSYAMHSIATDSTFFQLFNYPLCEGEQKLDAPTDAIIMRDYAERIFGRESAIGKSLVFNGSNITIRGVIDKPVCKTTLQPDIVVSFQLKKNWNRMITEILHVLPITDLQAINSKTNVYSEGKQPTRWEFKPWKELYFDSRLKDTKELKDVLQFGNRTYLRILSIVVALLLFVGILNFVNLYMVFMMKRSKEYGIKKVFGLQKMPLFLQIWTENLLLAMVALLVAWLLVEITQVPMSRLMHDEIHYSAFDWQLSLAFVMVLPFITSVYPYIRYNYMSPMVSIRSISGNRHSVIVRMGFLFVQNIITVLLIVVSLYFNKHLQYLLQTPPGFQTENILRAELTHENYSSNPADFKVGYEERVNRMQLIRKRLDECPYIESWIADPASILEGGSEAILFNDKAQKLTVKILFATDEFFHIHDLKVLEGTLPETKDMELVVNKTALKAFGYSNREEAFLRAETPLWVNFENGKITEGGTSLLPVKAVLEDYYPGHLTEGIKPIVFIASKIASSLYLDKVYIKIKPGHDKDIIEYLRKIEEEVYHTDDFRYSWLADEVKALYKEDRQIATVYSVFALIAIAVSCLGLFGISLFDIRQRYREIAIRKVNGAGLKDLYRLLFKKYLLVLVASFVVATPLAYYLINRYTADFAVKAPIGIGIFAWALLLIVTISVGTLWWQIRKASNIDPAVVMKTE